MAVSLLAATQAMTNNNSSCRGCRGWKRQEYANSRMPCHGCNSYVYRMSLMFATNKNQVSMLHLSWTTLPKTLCATYITIRCSLSISMAGLERPCPPSVTFWLKIWRQALSA